MKQERKKTGPRKRLTVERSAYVRTSVVLEPEMMERLRRFSVERRMSQAEVIRCAVGLFIGFADLPTFATE